MSTNANILDALQDPAISDGNRLHTKRYVLWLLAPVLMIGAWAALSLPGSGSEPSQASKSLSVPTRSASLEERTRASRVETVAAVSEPLASTAPSLEFEAAHPLNENLRVTPPPLPAAESVQLPVPSAPSAVMVEPRSPAQPTARAATATPPKPKPSPTTKVLTKVAPPAQEKVKKPARAVVQAKARPTPGSNNDPDVDLLSALMQHIGSSAQPASYTLAERVSECQQAARGDALACQRRVCAGLWGQAKACPRHLAPAQATPARESRVSE